MNLYIVYMDDMILCDTAVPIEEAAIIDARCQVLTNQ
jgi:hypothetical protein